MIKTPGDFEEHVDQKKLRLCVTASMGPVIGIRAKNHGDGESPANVRTRCRGGVVPGNDDVREKGTRLVRQRKLPPRDSMKWR